MILSVILSNPVRNNTNQIRKYEKIKVKIESSSLNDLSYFAEMFTQNQVFHKHMTIEEVEELISKNIGINFRNCVKTTDTQIITLLSNKKGEIRTFTKNIDNSNLEKNESSYEFQNIKLTNPSEKKKNYILKEGEAIPFLITLGIMTSSGKIISSKYDKFKQINRFLEFIDDILDDVIQLKQKENPENILKIVDFGCGKSYLTFAVQYFLSEIKHIPCSITGLDLKTDVINYCNKICENLNLNNLDFKTGSIENYSEKENPDIIITLHACDTATDFALKYAVTHECKAILSVPFCQHQINTQIKTAKDTILEPLLKYGIIKEKFSSLLTDALRGEWLENQGYSVQLLEFIDMEHTPKNILIRAIKNKSKNTTSNTENQIPKIVDLLNIKPEIFE